MQKEWYVVNTYSGHENKVKEKLEMRASTMGMEDYILRVVVPEQTEVEIKDGIQKEKVKKMFPGYILVEMVTYSAATLTFILVFAAFFSLTDFILANIKVLVG